MTGEQRRTVEQEIRGLDEEWKCLLRPWWKAGGYKIIKNLDDLLAEIGEENFHPSLCAAFRPFKCLKPCEVKVVIVGQDPYPCYRNATGLAFSLPKNEKRCPRRKYAPCVHSVYDALEKDAGIEGTVPEEVGNLDYLAKRRVLLMNASFTYSCKAKKRGGKACRGEDCAQKSEGCKHQCIKKEWHNFSGAVVTALLNEKEQKKVFMFWGGDAQNLVCEGEPWGGCPEKWQTIFQDWPEAIKKGSRVIGGGEACVNGHKIFSAHHPSYKDGQCFINGAGRGKHFSKANEFLAENGLCEIGWLPD